MRLTLELERRWLWRAWSRYHYDHMWSRMVRGFGLRCGPLFVLVEWKVR